MTSFISKSDYYHKLFFLKNQDNSLLQSVNIWKQQILLKREEKKKHWGLVNRFFLQQHQIAMFLYAPTVKKSKMFYYSWSWEQKGYNSITIHFIFKEFFIILCDTLTYGIPQCYLSAQLVYFLSMANNIVIELLSGKQCPSWWKCKFNTSGPYYSCVCVSILLGEQRFTLKITIN